MSASTEDKVEESFGVMVLLIKLCNKPNANASIRPRFMRSMYSSRGGPSIVYDVLKYTKAFVNRLVCLHPSGILLVLPSAGIELDLQCLSWDPSSSFVFLQIFSMLPLSIICATSLPTKSTGSQTSST